MKICRVSISYPTTSFPAAGLVNYYLTKNIKKSTLYITIKRAGKPLSINSNHLKIKFLNAKINPSPKYLSKRIRSYNINLYSKIIIFFNLFIHFKGIIFFIKSIPHIFKFNPNIIACHSNLTILHGIFFKIFLKKKFVLHLHELSEVNSIINFKILRYFVSKAERIYCVSKKMQHELSKKINKNKIFLTSTGVDPKKFYNLQTKRKEQLIIVGRIQWHKGHKYMIRAMTKISKSFPNYKLIIIGEGEEKNNLLREAAKYNVSNYISFHPVISQDDLFQIYNESKLLVMPSLFEGLPKVLLEAFACGLPAVITDKCNAEEISKGRAIVVKSESSDELSNAVISLLSNNEKWAEFAKESESIIDTHNWDNITEKIYEDYKNILKNE